LDTWAILLAAGKGTRLQQIREKKQFLDWKGVPLYWHTAKNIANVPEIRGIIFVFPQEELESRKDQLQQITDSGPLGINIKTVGGGKSRRDSAFKALQELPPECEGVIIHDAARPFATPKLFNNIINELKNGIKSVIPGIPVADTIKQMGDQGIKTLPREKLFAIQTPQGFDKETIQEIHRQAREIDLDCTDDSYLVEYFGEEVNLIPGEEENQKITNPGDLYLLKENATRKYIHGWGYDVHKYGPGKPMKLGGIPITNGPEVVAHSDGDVLLHALIDALLGCLGQGDIGEHFPDTEPKYQDINSSILLAEVLAMAQKQSVFPEHVDITLICQTPKLSPWKNQIKNNLTNLLDLAAENVNIKSTTEEGLGFTGEKKGIKSVVMLSAHKR